MAPKEMQLLKKMYLLSEATIEKIKDVEDMERNFTTLDKAMKEVLYNKKLNDHEKLQYYKNFLDKYLHLRKQLIAKHVDKPQPKAPKAPTLDFNQMLSQIPRPKTKFKAIDTVVFPEKFLFNHTVKPVKDVDLSMIELPASELMAQPQPQSQLSQEAVQPSEDVYMADGEHDEYYGPSAASAAKDALSGANDTAQDVSMLDLSNKTCKLYWNKTAYRVPLQLKEKFREFVAKIRKKFPGALRVDPEDFSKYLVDGTLSISSIENKPKFEAVAAVKRKSVTQTPIKSTTKKQRSVADVFPQKKKLIALKPSLLDRHKQTGEGLKKQIKWKSFR